VPPRSAGQGASIQRTLVILLLLALSGCVSQSVTAVPTPTAHQEVTATSPRITATAAPSPVPTLRPLPTPSLTPFLLPASCSEAQLVGLARQFITAINAGDARQLQALLTQPEASDEWFAVVPRDLTQLTTATFTTQPDEFVRYVLARHTQNEQIVPLELVDLRGRTTTANTALLMLAAVRQAVDIPAKPAVLLFVLDCQQERVRGLTITDAPVTTVPQTPVQLLNTALRQRPLESPETQGKSGVCPRSAWAFGRAVGTSPAYAEFGPDAVINLGGPVAHADGTGWYTFPIAWHLAPGYRGPVLIRGVPLDGQGQVLLGGEGASAESSGLLLLPHDLQSQADGWASWRMEGALNQPGCYAVFIDGVVFHQALVFQAVDGSADHVADLTLSRPLPDGLQLLSAFQTPTGSVQLAFASDYVVLRVVQTRGPLLSTVAPSPSQCQESAIGLICWTNDPTSGWPATASWSDGPIHYQLVALQATAVTWTANDLVAFAEALHDAQRVLSPTASPTSS